MKNKKPMNERNNIPPFAVNRILKYVGNVSKCMAVSSTFVPQHYTRHITFLKNSCLCRFYKKLKSVSSLNTVVFNNCHYVNTTFVKNIVAENPEIENFVFIKCSHIDELPLLSDFQRSCGTDVLLYSQKLSFRFMWRCFHGPDPSFSPMDVFQIVAAAYSDRLSGGLYNISDFFIKRSLAKMQLFVIAPYINELYHYPFEVRSNTVMGNKAFIIVSMDKFSLVVFIFQRDANQCWKITKGFEADMTKAWMKVNSNAPLDEV